MSYLRRRDHGVGVHHAVGVFLADLGDQQGAHAGPSTTAYTVADLETLEAVGVLGLLAAGIKDLVDHFCALGVVSLGPVITGAGILVDEVVRPEKFTERTCTNRIDNSGFKVKKHRTRHVLAACCLMVKDVDAVELGVVVANFFLIFKRSNKN